MLSQVLVHETWASLAIAVMWLAVLFDARFRPDLVVSNASGDDHYSIGGHGWQHSVSAGRRAGDTD